MHWRMGVAACISLTQLVSGCSSEEGFAVHKRYTSCAFGDFDRDGDQDLFLGQIAGSDERSDVLGEADDLFINDGTGNFVLAEGALPPRSGGLNFGVVSAEAADFNADGHLDLILSRVAPDQLSGAGLQLLLNDGSGNFADASDGIPESFAQDNWLPFAIPADFDDDGFPDIAISAGFGERSLILRNAGDGTFVSHREHLDLINVDYGQLLHGDMDGDGRVDLVTVIGDVNESRVEVLLNRSAGAGSIAWEALPTMYITVQGASGALLDWDTDGDLDLITTNFIWPPAVSEDGVRLFENDGNGGLSEAPTAMLIDGPIQTAHPRFFSVADFNGDSRMDLLIADHGIDQPPFPGFQNALLIQQANGGVANESVARFGERSGFTHCACAADIDNDQDVDLLACDLNADQESGVVISINDGTGQFEDVLLDVPRRLLD